MCSFQILPLPRGPWALARSYGTPRLNPIHHHQQLGSALSRGPPDDQPMRFSMPTRGRLSIADFAGLHGEGKCRLGLPRRMSFAVARQPELHEEHSRMKEDRFTPNVQCPAQAYADHCGDSCQCAVALRPTCVEDVRRKRKKTAPAGCWPILVGPLLSHPPSRNETGAVLLLWLL